MNINKFKNKKIIILLVILLIIIITLALISKREEILQSIGIQKQKQELNEKINLKVEIKQETEEAYNCLLTFTANSDNDKIKEIEYPAEEGKETNKIQISNEDGKGQVAIDYEVKKDDLNKTFIVTTKNNNVEEEKTGYIIEYKDSNGETFEKVTQLKSLKQKIINKSPKKENEHFVGWSTDNNQQKPDYFENGEYSQSDEDVILYPMWIAQSNGENDTLNNDSLLGEVSKINQSVDQTTITVNGENYTAHVIVKNEDIVLDGENTIEGATLQDNIYEFGDKDKDVAKLNVDGVSVEDAKNMVILKINGNLTINSNVTLTACKSDDGYGGPKGLLIYCTGTLTNNGTIDMTARGARAEGQNVFLWKNDQDLSGTESEDIIKGYEYVPKDGGIGGAAVRSKGEGGDYHKSGLQGSNGINRQTGRRWLWWSCITPLYSCDFWIWRARYFLFRGDWWSRNRLSIYTYSRIRSKKRWCWRFSI